ncbi:hypothetical protein JCM11251_000964 [Rhodosporidiobolus azoricus]
MMLPHECKAYLFEKEDGELRKGMRQLPQLKEYEIMIKVMACSLNSTDEIGRFGLLPEVRFPAPPGACVVCKVVGCGGKVMSLSMGGMKIREGMCVTGLPMYGGLSEYVVCDARLCTELPKEWMHSKEKAMEACIDAWVGGRVHCAVMRFCEMHERMSKEEKEMCLDMCEQMGFKGEGVFAVYGEFYVSPLLAISPSPLTPSSFSRSGAARLAIDMLKAMRDHGHYHMMSSGSKKCRIVLITPTSKWSAEDCGIHPLCSPYSSVHSQVRRAACRTQTQKKKSTSSGAPRSEISSVPATRGEERGEYRGGQDRDE